MTGEERLAWLEQLRGDVNARRKDLLDLSLFMLTTGVRIGQALAPLWTQVDLDAGLVEIAHTIIRFRREGLVREGKESKAGNGYFSCLRPRLRCCAAGS